VCNEHLSKGSKVFIEGKLRTRKWEDQDGNIRYSTEIVVRDLEMLGGRLDNSESVPDDGMDVPLPENDIPF